MKTGRTGHIGASPRLRARRILATVVGALTLLSALSAARAGPLVALDRLEGQPVLEVRVRAPSDVDIRDIERLAGLEVGAPLEAEALRAAVERLHQVDRFTSVIARGRPTAGGVVVEFLLEPRLRVSAIVFPSGLEVGRGWLESRLGLERGDEIHARDLPDLKARLLDALESRGWRSSQLELELERQDDTGRVELMADLQLGPLTRLAQVRLRGWLPFPTYELDVGIAPGEPLRLDRVEAALEALRVTLRERGHYDVVVAPPEVVELPPAEGGGPRANLVVEIDPGPRTEVRFSGNERVARRRLREDVEILEDLGTEAAALIEAKERILARYERLGYPTARVEVFGRTTPDRRRRQVLFRIDEGRPVAVTDIRFDGVEAFDEGTLEAQVRATVERFLAPALGRPGVDPEVVDAVLRGSPGRAGRERPSTAAPDAEQVYVPRAYRAGTDAIADLYRSEGFQLVRVGEPRVEVAGPGSVEVVYPIHEGLRWTVGSVAFSGHEGVLGAELLEAVQLASTSTRARPLTFESVEEGRRAILQLYRDRGHLFATVREELREVPERGARGGRFFSPRTDMPAICAEAEREQAESCEVEVAYRIEEGPQVRTRDIIVRGLDETRTTVVEGEIVLRPGEILSDRDMTRTRDNLVRLGVFDRVVVRPIEEDRAAPVKDVLIEVRERDNLSMELGVGASTEEGLRAFASFANRNLFGTALRLQTNAKLNLWAEPLLSIYEDGLQEDIRDFYCDFSVFAAGSVPDGQRCPHSLLLVEFEVAAGVSYPRIFLLPEGFSFGLDVIFLRDYDPAFAEENLRVTLIGSYEGFEPRLFGKERRMALQLRLNFETAQLVCNEAVEGREDLCSSGVAPGLPGGVNTEGQNTYLSAGPRVSWDFRDDPLDPGAGAYLELEGQAAKGFDETSPDYLRLVGRIDAYAPVAPRVTFFASFRGGRIFSLEPDADIPLNRRFFAGGRSTIRGYPEKTLLPQDTPLGPNGAPLSNVSAGGVVYLVFKTELRVELVSPVSIAGFFDIGDLWRVSDGGGICGATAVSFVTECTLSNGSVVRRRLAKGGGFGLRIATPIGPLAVDMGFPLDRRDPAVDNWTLHFSVGAF